MERIGAAPISRKTIEARFTYTYTYTYAGIGTWRPNTKCRHSLYLNNLIGGLQCILRYVDRESELSGFPLESLTAPDLRTFPFFCTLKIGKVYCCTNPLRALVREHPILEFQYKLLRHSHHIKSFLAQNLGNQQNG